MTSDSRCADGKRRRDFVMPDALHDVLRLAAERRGWRVARYVRETLREGLPPDLAASVAEVDLS
jgi:hypothetical protein